MPNWQPNWNNVRWDWGAANAASSALRRSADKLNGYAHERANVANDAQREFRGRYSEEFDQQLRAMLTRSRDLAAEMRDAAGRIDHASSRAWDEQRRRDRDRERWWREKREEDRRREEEERRRRGG